MHLNYVKTDSYVSLVDTDNRNSETLLQEDNKRVPSYIFGVDNTGIYLKADNSVWGENLFVERCIESSIATNRYKSIRI